MAWFRCGAGNTESGGPYTSADVNMQPYQLSTTTKIDVNVYAEEGREIVFVIMHRSNIIGTPSGVTLIYETPSASADGQRISFYKATIDSTGSIVGIFTQQTSARMALTHVIFKPGTTFSHSGDYLAVISTSAYSFSAPNKTPGARLLWAVSMNSMDTSGSVAQFTSPADLLEMSYPPGNSDRAPRLAVYYDDGTGAATGRTFYNNGSQFNTACVMDALEIE